MFGFFKKLAEVAENRAIDHAVLRMAADKGVAEAQRDLGKCYYNGQGVPQDYAEAIKWYRMAADQGDVIARCCLGYCYDRGQGVPQDHAEAIKWFRTAADQGDATAQRNLGLCYYDGKGVAANFVEAAKWHRKAADQALLMQKTISPSATTPATACPKIWSRRPNG